ncbi:CU044_5270 family protein [Nonomuraea roseola]|uniref:CU044_5270 family protein n=1 Tax=Nonomuraea roseola TaxID=46179 RepID=A0ABV5PX35_9ACTN
MDEITLLSQSLPDAPPPSAEATARARASVLAAERASTPARKPARDRRGSRWSWGWTVGAALATATVITTVIVLVSTMAPVAAPVLARPTGIDLLLQAAENASRQPPADGAYWRRTQIGGGLLRTGEPPYTLRAEESTELWQPRDPATPGMMERRTRSVRPASPQDEQAWRAAGAPERVRNICPSGAGSCASVKVSAVPTDCSYRWTRDGRVPEYGVGKFTVEDLRKLPDDPDRLREALRPYHRTWYDNGFTQSFEDFLPSTASLLWMPIEPGTRAALLRMLATLPGTKVHGETVDPLGRPGISVSFDDARGTVSFGKEEVEIQGRTVIDLATGAPLADLDLAVDTGRIMGYEALESARWTDSAPQEPSNCKKLK